MGLFDSLFSTSPAPTMSTTDYTAAANQGAAYNAGQAQNYQSYAPQLTSFMQQLYGNTVNPQATSAQNSIYNIGSQLANNGSTNLMGNYFQYLQQQGLQQAASTGAPLSGSFGQSLGANLSTQQLLQNQLQGTNILNGYSQNQQNLALGFMAPANGILNSSLVNPQAFMQGAQQNNQINNQNAQINYANSQQQSWFNNLLTGAAQSFISTPFSTFENLNSTAANMPQTATGAFFGGGSSNGGGGGGGGGLGMLAGLL